MLKDCCYRKYEAFLKSISEAFNKERYRDTGNISKNALWTVSVSNKPLYLQHLRRYYDVLSTLEQLNLFVPLAAKVSYLIISNKSM